MPARVSEEPIEFGKILFGQEEYSEFVCSKSTARWLMSGGMTHLDGKPVHLQVMDELRGGHNVVVHIWERYDTPT